jgi:hypothetical protein
MDRGLRCSASLRLRSGWLDGVPGRFGDVLPSGGGGPAEVSAGEQVGGPARVLFHIKAIQPIEANIRTNLLTRIMGRESSLRQMGRQCFSSDLEVEEEGRPTGRGQSCGPAPGRLRCAVGSGRVGRFGLAVSRLGRDRLLVSRLGRDRLLVSRLGRDRLLASWLGRDRLRVSGLAPDRLGAA